MGKAGDGPRILSYDIETCGVQSLFADRAFVVCFGYKWLGDKEAKCISINEYPGKNVHDDKNLLVAALEIVQKADLLVAHYGDKFDRKFLEARLLRNRLPPLPITRQVDTCLISRFRLKLSSNRLGNLAEFLQVKTGKMNKRGGWPDWWMGALRGDKQSIKEMAAYCITPDHKLLGSDLRWRQASDFKVGDTVLGFDEHGAHRRYRNATIQRMEYFPTDVFEVRLESGKTFRVTEDHQWLVATRRSDGTNQARSFRWLRTDQLATKAKYSESGRCSAIPKLFDIWNEDSSREAGWLAGIIDGEGYISKSNGSIGIGQNPGIVLDRIEKLLSVYAPGQSRRQTNQDRKCQTVRVNGTLAQRFKFLGTIRPDRLISKLNFDNLGRLEARNGFDGVVSVTPIGKQIIVAIRTSTGTFVCDGYPMHNCAQDVQCLEECYLALRHIIPEKYLINMAIGNELNACKSCGNIGIAHEGYYYSPTRTYRRYSCKRCGKWGRYSTVLHGPQLVKK